MLEKDKILVSGSFISFVYLILIIAAISEEEWFSQGSVSIPNEVPNYFNGIKGGLLHSKDFELFDETDGSWKSLMNDCSDEVYGYGLCEEISNFYHLGIIYITIDSFSILSSAIGFFLSLIHIFKIKIKKKFPIPLILIFYNFSWILHLIGFIIWSIGVDLSTGNCQKVPYEENFTNSVCSSTGAKLAISAIPIGFVGIVIYAIFWYKYKTPLSDAEISMV
jgi:hypothetical protein